MYICYACICVIRQNIISSIIFSSNYGNRYILNTILNKKCAQRELFSTHFNEYSTWTFFLPLSFFFFFFRFWRPLNTFFPAIFCNFRIFRPTTECCYARGKKHVSVGNKLAYGLTKKYFCRHIAVLLAMGQLLSHCWVNVLERLSDQFIF